MAIIPPLFMGEAWFDWIYRALVLLVVACPCALVISTPVTIVRRLDARLFKTEFCRFVGHAVLCMLITYEAFFFGRCYQLAVDIQSGGRVMAQGAGQAKNRQCHRLCLLKMQAGGGRLRKRCVPLQCEESLKSGIIA